MSRSLKGRKVIPQPKLLVVDDRTENLKACKALLSCSGYEIDTASSGNEALRKLLVDEYFCILLDINMPEMDGIETAKLIRRDPCFQTLPIIFVTAHNFDDKMINEAYAVGATSKSL
jgi:CheY-like chemotaxis protein